MTGATVPLGPRIGCGQAPTQGQGPCALPANYLLLCVCITSSALVVRTLGLVHLRTGSSDRGYLSRGPLAVSHSSVMLLFRVFTNSPSSSSLGPDMRFLRAVGMTAQFFRI